MGAVIQGGFSGRAPSPVGRRWPEGAHWVQIVLAVLLSAGSAHSATWYVATNGNDTAAGTNWATARRTIQSAIDTAISNDTVIVSNGIYDTGGRVVYGAMTNRLVIDKPITVRSVNGPEVTVIKGNGPRGDAAVRCVYVGMNATLSGFLLTNGNTSTTGDTLKEQSGGGAWCEFTGVISNCVLSHNSATYYGGGTFYGALDKCTLSCNFAYRYGGGAYSSALSRCWLIGNSAVLRGGGAYICTLSNCTISGNFLEGAGSGGGTMSSTLNGCLLSVNSASFGGGACESLLNNCSVTGNFAHVGGGAMVSTLSNCTISGNAVDNDGGGVNGGTLVNCTVVGNSSGMGLSQGRGGGANGSKVINCIIYYNAAGIASTANHWSGQISYSCTTPLPFMGTGCITNAPSFQNPGSGHGTNHVAGDYRLLPTSPCIDRGANIWAAGDVDLDGNPRVVNWIPDMGAYEYQGIVDPDTDGDGIPNDWEGPHGLNPAVSNAPTANADGDLHTDWQEYVADTAPTNALDYLRLLDIQGEPSPDMIVSFTSSTSRFYTLEYSTDLVSGVWTNVPGQVPRPGIGGLDHMQDTNALPEAPARFYRVRATLP